MTTLRPTDATVCTCDVFPPSWRGLSVLCPVHGDVRDTSLDTPGRQAGRGVSLEKLTQLRDTPVFKGCGDGDAVWEEYLVLPIIHVRVRTADREKTANDLRRDLVVHVGGLHVEGFDPLYAVSPAIDVV